MHVSDHVLVGMQASMQAEGQRSRLGVFFSGSPPCFLRLGLPKSGVLIGWNFKHPPVPASTALKLGGIDFYVNNEDPNSDPQAIFGGGD